MKTIIGLLTKKWIVVFVALAIMLPMLATPVYALEGGCNHDFTYWQTAYPPACTTTGLEQLICDYCEAVLDTREIPATGHAESEWITECPPSCTSDGSKKIICYECNAVLATDTIPATGHTPGEVYYQHAGCTTDGYWSQECANCCAIISEYTIPAYGHDPGEWTTITPATCTTAGVKQTECTYCFQTYTESIAPLGHEYGNWSHVEGTSGSSSQHSRSCIRGDSTQTESCVAGDWVITVPPCTQDGERVKYCTECGYVLETETLDEEGHITVWRIIQEATPTVKGLRIRYCTVCGEDIGNPVTYKLPK